MMTAVTYQQAFVSLVLILWDPAVDCCFSLVNRQQVVDRVIDGYQFITSQLDACPAAVPKLVIDMSSTVSKQLFTQEENVVQRGEAAESEEAQLANEPHENYMSYKSTQRSLECAKSFSNRSNLDDLNYLSTDMQLILEAKGIWDIRAQVLQKGIEEERISELSALLVSLCIGIDVQCLTACRFRLCTFRNVAGRTCHGDA